MTRKNLVSALMFLGTFLFAAIAFAEDAPAAADAAAPLSGAGGLALFGSAFAIAVAAFGGALGQGRAAAAALEGIARNPGASGKLFTPMILGLALIESLVIYALVVAILIMGAI